jgi:uncharacterized protein (TIGR02996 family)
VLRLAIIGPYFERVVDVREGELVFGRAEQNDVVLAHPTVSPRHARLVARGPRVIIADLASDNGTWINGHRLDGPHPLAVGDRIEIGRYAITASDARAVHEPPGLAHHDATEAALLAQIAAGDHDSRPVYADWLEERAHSREAAFVRAQDELVALRIRRDDVVTPADAPFRWRAAIARPPIEACDFDFECPKEWGSLAPTAQPGVRMCGACKKPVYYCDSVADAREHAANARCVALDLSAARIDDDLGPPYGETCEGCGTVAGEIGSVKCASCGKALRVYTMRMGMVAVR